MGTPHDTVIQLNVEGISVIADLADFDKDSIKQLASNLHHPGGMVPDPNPAAAPGVRVLTPPFVFGDQEAGTAPTLSNLEKTLEFFTQTLHYPTLECIHIHAGMCRTCPVPTSKHAFTCGLLTGCNPVF